MKPQILSPERSQPTDYSPPPPGPQTWVQQDHDGSISTHSASISALGDAVNTVYEALAKSEKQAQIDKQHALDQIDKLNARLEKQFTKLEEQVSTIAQIRGCSSSLDNGTIVNLTTPMPLVSYLTDATMGEQRAQSCNI